jgi:hypothetical protein
LCTAKDASETVSFPNHNLQPSINTTLQKVRNRCCLALLFKASMQRCVCPTGTTCNIHQPKNLPCVEGTNHWLFLDSITLFTYPIQCGPRLQAAASTTALFFYIHLRYFCQRGPTTCFFKSFEYFLLEINFLVFLDYFDNVKNEFKK